MSSRGIFLGGGFTADEKYIIPPEPAYRLHGIRRLQNTDPGNADKVLNPVFEPILESVEYLNRHKTGQAQGHGPPGPATPGGAGGHYFDIDSGRDYVCTGQDENGWLWRLAGAVDASDMMYGDRPLDEALGGLEDGLRSMGQGFSTHAVDKSNPHEVTAGQVGAVPATRKVNGKALNVDITLTAADVGARPSTWTPTAADVGAMAQVFHAGAAAPSNTKLLWIDTTAGTGGLKYYNGSKWVHVPVAYT